LPTVTSEVFEEGTSNYGTYIQTAIFWASKPCSLIAETCSRCLQSQVISARMRSAT